MSNGQHISYEIVEEIAYIGFGLNEEKSMTTLTSIGLNELMDKIDALTNYKMVNKLKGVIFFSHKDNCFLAGVDVNLIASLNSANDAQEGAEKGQEIYNKIEDLGVPTVACVNGPCLGGGLELALSCKYILAGDDPKTSLALPEVKLGVLPGFGGTYRLPKKIGYASALDLILTGKSLNSKKAYKLNLVEGVYPKENLIEKAKELIIHGYKKKTDFKEDFKKFAMDNIFTRKIIFQKAREAVLKQTKGFYQAPLKILDHMENSMSKSRKSYLQSEAMSFGELAVSEQGRNLQHIFFMMDDSKKHAKNLSETIRVKKGAVLGAGTMGGGIAWLFADNDQSPYMKDINQQGLELGLRQSAKNFLEKVKRKKMSEVDFERKQRSITPTLNYKAFKSVDLVIEAVVEDMNVKKKVFSELENYVTNECLITSNTSSLSINEMSKAFQHPERFAGLHFFNPVHKMPLVEIIKHDKVSQKTIDSLYKWAVDVKKTPVVVGDGPGFLVNRILMPYINESAYLLLEGVHPEKLDQAVLNFGMPMGPCRLMDEVGIDVLVKVGKIMEKGLGDRAKDSGLAAKLVEKGLLGKKTSKGIYNYNEKGHSNGLNDEALEILPKNAKDMSEIDIQLRVFLPMINEAANILQEKIVENARDVDLGLIFGIGFPPFRGGLLRYADQEGTDKIFNAIERLSVSVHSERYRPSTYLKDLATQNKKFYDL